MVPVFISIQEKAHTENKKKNQLQDEHNELFMFFKY